MSIIDRLARNAQKQKEYRHIVRGRSRGSLVNVKRQADMFFLRKYGKLTMAKVAEICKVCPETVASTLKKKTKETQFTICHPNRSCM